MIQNQGYKFKGAGKKLITADLSWMAYKQPVPICIFAHGFKGFKDWGAWPLAAQIFALKNIPFFKFNFSHNGTSPSSLDTFSDPEAFGNNNLKMEYDELGLVMDFIESKKPSFEFDWNGEFFVIGHSRGGCIALMRTANDPRISKCVLWAAPADIEQHVQMAPLDKWEKEGVHYVKNTRTEQNMPVYWQFYLNYYQYEGLLNSLENMEKIKQDLLIVHGEEDTTIPIENAEKIFDSVAHSIMIRIEKADHTFGTSHPLTEKKISVQFAQVIEETLEFFQL